MSLKLHSELIEKLEILIQDPYNYLYEYLTAIKTDIDIKNEKEPLKNYEELIKELDDFQSERKKLIEDNIVKIKNHYSHRIEYSKMLSNWLESKDKLFKDEIEANITSLNNSIFNLKMAIMDHKNISFNGSQIVRTPVHMFRDENLKVKIESDVYWVKYQLNKLDYLRERHLNHMNNYKPKSKETYKAVKASQERSYEDFKSFIFKDEQFIESLVTIGRHTQNHKNSISNILKLESLKLDN